MLNQALILLHYQGQKSDLFFLFKWEAEIQNRGIGLSFQKRKEKKPGLESRAFNFNQDQLFSLLFLKRHGLQVQQSLHISEKHKTDYGWHMVDQESGISSRAHNHLRVDARGSEFFCLAFTSQIFRSQLLLPLCFSASHLNLLSPSTRAPSQKVTNTISLHPNHVQQANSSWFKNPARQVGIRIFKLQILLCCAIQ